MTQFEIIYTIGTHTKTAIRKTEKGARAFATKTAARDNFRGLVIERMDADMSGTTVKTIYSVKA